jgi:ribosomal protein S18 acetylase RimI-like enzyme
MEQAYRDTVDDEGETKAQFSAEARETLADKWGKFISEASFSIWKNGQMVAASVITIWREKPLLAYSVTRPDCQGQGMASQLIQQSMNSLHGLSYQEVELGVTRGNTPAENLYRKLGFQVIA